MAKTEDEVFEAIKGLIFFQLYGLYSTVKTGSDHAFVCFDRKLSSLRDSSAVAGKMAKLYGLIFSIQSICFILDYF